MHSGLKMHYAVSEYYLSIFNAFLNFNFCTMYVFSYFTRRHYLITGRHLVGCKVKEIRVVCAKPADDGTDMQGE